MDQFVEHMAHDELVGSGRKPGDGRKPVPGTQEEFGKIFRAWADTCVEPLADDVDERIFRHDLQLYLRIAAAIFEEERLDQHARRARCHVEPEPSGRPA
jgi:hypothetical protein